MHRDVPNSDEDLDRRLRAVPVPSGLALRLVAIADASGDGAETREGAAALEATIDRVRDVPVPPGLQARLRSIPIVDDDADHGDDLDRLVAAARGNSAAFELNDGELDIRLRDVSVPYGLTTRLRGIAGRSITWRRLATAAALLLLIGGVYGFVALNTIGPEGGVSGRRDDALVLNLREAVEAAGDARFSAPQPASSGISATPAIAALPTTLDAERARLDLRHRSLTTKPSTRLDVFQATAWALGATASYSGLQGASPRDALPDLPKAATHMPRGVEVPLSAEGRKFLLDYGTFPSVTPREFPISVVPLTHDTTGYELARAYLNEGQWPPADKMRTEEFLAAVDYAYGRPSDKGARLIAAGAIAPWNPPSPPDRPLPAERVSRLLQLSVQARELPSAPRPATHLTVGIDVTESMQAGGRMEMVRGALKSLIARLGGGDRLTLVALGGSNPVIVEEGSRAELEQLLSAADWLSAGGSGDLSGGILTACATAARREPPRNVVRRVVIVSDAFNEFDPTGLRTVEQFLKSSAGRGLKVDLIDVGGDNEETPWEDLVRRRDGRTFRVVTGERIRSALMESLTGRSQTVASDARLTLTLQPQLVTGYRLLGHEPTALAGLVAQRIEIDLHAGQTATLLYELQVTAGRGDQEIGTAVLTWRDPVDGTPQETVQSITRGMLSPAFERASTQLQLATIAASLAGRLRNSPWGDNVAPAEVLQWARRLDRLGTVRGVAPWLTLAEQVTKLPPPRRGTTGRTNR
jgi:Ca-activated chloride channel family protein